VIVDEAGMAATADLARLVHLAIANEWRLVAVGDPDQLPAVGRGGTFAHWCNTLPHHTLGIPRRFEHSWEAQASLALRDGRPEAVDAYLSHRRIHTAHPVTLPALVARAHRRHIDAGRTVAVTTTTAEMARAINRQIQRHAGGGSGVALHDGTDARIGDQVATRLNDPTLRTHHGQQVRNRQTWTVTATHNDGRLTVTNPERGSVALPAGYVARHVELGWAVTGYGNQGDTVDVGIAVIEASTTGNHAYVAMTRGRHANHALIADPTGTTDPAERLTEIITRPATADSALAVEDHLHRAAGIEPPDPICRVEPAPQQLPPPVRTPEPTRSSGPSLGL
jgi:ATP-dependent exoDNAse (exonuclease V) alpha subunit